MTHHDWLLPGYENDLGPLGKLEVKVLRGANLVVNGHIHRQLAGISVRNITLAQPRQHRPSQPIRCQQEPQADAPQGGYWQEGLVDRVCQCARIEPYKEIFHEVIVDDDGLPLFEHTSAFIHGLAELQARRTDTGAGLVAFLDNNLSPFPEAVQTEIRSLAEQVLNHGTTDDE
jgi:hypothetical protein